MGLIAKSQTKKLVAPQTIPWQEPLDVPDWMMLPELLYVSAVGMLAVAANHDLGSSVQIELTRGGFALSASGWAMLGTITHKSVVLAVTRYRTQYDELFDKKAIVRSRAWLQEALAEGTTVEMKNGLPDFHELIVPVVLPSFLGIGTSDLEGDMLPPLPACFHDGATLRFPEDAAPVLAAALKASGGSDGYSDEEVCVVEVAVWSDENRGRIVLCVSEGEARLVVCCPGLAELSAIGAGRIFRSTMRALSEIGGAMDEGPAIREVINAYVDACERSLKAPDRVAGLVPLWTSKIPAPALSLRAGMDLPIGLVVTSRVPLSFDEVLAAESSLLVRQRAANRGVTRKALLSNPKYGTRRPAVLLDRDGATVPYLRYVEMGESDAFSLAWTGQNDRWFWEAALLDRGQDEHGRHRSLLLAEGLSLSHGIVAYGTELLTLYRALAANLRATDPDAQIETIYARLPSAI
jgi:hypothetical protein